MGWGHAPVRGGVGAWPCRRPRTRPPPQPPPNPQPRPRAHPPPSSEANPCPCRTTLSRRPTGGTGWGGQLGREGGAPVAAVGALVVARARRGEAEAEGEDERTEEHGWRCRCDRRLVTMFAPLNPLPGRSRGYWAVKSKTTERYRSSNGRKRTPRPLLHCYKPYSKPIHALHSAGWPETASRNSASTSPG